MEKKESGGLLLPHGRLVYLSLFFITIPENGAKRKLFSSAIPSNNIPFGSATHVKIDSF